MISDRWRKCQSLFALGGAFTDPLALREYACKHLGPSRGLTAAVSCDEVRTRGGSLDLVSFSVGKNC